VTDPLGRTVLGHVTDAEAADVGRPP